MTVLFNPPSDMPLDAIGNGQDSPDVFDQAGIDALFGFGASEERQPPRMGLRGLLNTDVVNRERLPMLEVIGERMARSLATSMRNLTSDALDVSLRRIVTSRFGDFVHRLPLPTMVCVFRVEEWDNYGLISFDPALIYAVVDSLMGGRRLRASPRVDGRAFTAIEIMLVSRIIRQMLDDFVAAFAAIEPITATLERIETTPRFAAIVGPSNLAAVATFSVDMEGRGGPFEMVLPHATIEPVRDRLAQRFVGEKLGRDTLWERHMASQLLCSEFELEAVLGERLIPVSTYMNLKVGQTIGLQRRPDDPLDIVCRGQQIGTAGIGQRSGTIAVQVIDTIITEDD